MCHALRKSINTAAVMWLLSISFLLLSVKYVTASSVDDPRRKRNFFQVYVE